MNIDNNSQNKSDSKEHVEGTKTNLSTPPIVANITDEKTTVSWMNAVSPRLTINYDTNLQDDIIAKQRGHTNKAAVKPGASFYNNNLRSIEADILAKQTTSSFRALASSTSPQDPDVIAKRMGNGSFHSTEPSVSSVHQFEAERKPGASFYTNNLRSIEADILAKQTTSSFREQDPDVIAKQMGRTITNRSLHSTSHSVSSFHQFEADILAKQTAGKSRLAPLTSSIQHRDVITKKVVPFKSGKNSSKLHNLEAEIVAKQTRGATRSVASSASLEVRDVVAKQDGRSVSVAPIQVDYQSRVNMPAKCNNPNCMNYLQNFEDHVDQKPSANVSKMIKFNEPEFPKFEENKHDPLMVNTDACQNAARTMISTDDNLPSFNCQDFDASVQIKEICTSPRLNVESLVVAVAVDEEDCDLHLPSAVEYEPDAKPPMYRNRRFHLYATLMAVAMICGTVGPVLVSIFINESESRHIPYRMTLGIRENVELAIGKENLDDPTNPYRKALDWIIFSDPMQLTPDSPRLFQRYILVYFYYTTSQSGPWTNDCAPSSEVYTKDECKHVVVVDKYEKGVDDQGRKGIYDALRWLSGTDECNWAGITCDKMNQIQSIALSDIGITGTFVHGITYLPYLDHIVLKYGKLEGSLPEYIFDRMKGLRRIILDDQMLTGTIPRSWFESRLPIEISVQNNNITDNLSNIPRAVSTRVLNLNGNKLTGSIPIEINEMLNINSIGLSNNLLTGTIPHIGSLRQIGTLDLSRNFLTGTIHDDVGQLHQLTDFVINENLLSGTIPDSIYRCSSLHHIRIGNNNISGTISGQISKLLELVDFDISNNQFTGTLPMRLPKKQLLHFRASGNRLNGTVNINICNLHLKELELDCAEPIDGGAPEIFCPVDCCTVCCTPDGLHCNAAQKDDDT